ncbi:hypothetical protein ES706_06786 [subsurface metagenome]
MSKPVRKHKRSRKRIEPHKHKVSAPARRGGAWRSTAKLQGVKPFVPFIIIAILAAIPFCMGKYFEFNSPGAFDSGSYVYSARHILEGAKIGIDEKPSAQMGTLLVNILGVRLFGFNETGPKLIQTILQAGALVLMFFAMVKLFGVLPATVGVIIASIYLSAPLMAKYGNVKEQHMIAFMVLGVSCFVLYQLGNRWWYAILAGAFLSLAPLFKETGISAITAVGLFVIAQPLLKHRSWKKTGIDILLLIAGAALIISPICLWLAVEKAPINYFPYYSFVGRPLAKSLQGSQDQTQEEQAEPNAIAGTVQPPPARQGLLMKFMPAYVRDSWQILKPEQTKEAKLRVFRWYRVLILPIALALGSIVLRIAYCVLRLFFARRITHDAGRIYDRFVLLFAVWWLLDMAFVWISPRSYEQYYLPLNASAAMLGGYLIAIYHNKVKSATYKPMWMITGFVGIVLMIIMSWHIFFGLKKSPHTGAIYRDRATGNPEKDKGYAQKMNEISQHPKYDWVLVGEHIRNNSTQKDKIYVWGWVPGIYVAAQRLSPTPKAFEGTMHTISPEVLSERIDEILDAFEKEPPKFIVDSRKRHFPWDRPPLELWPQTQKGFLPANEQIAGQYDTMYAKMLREKIEPDEALRYEAMKPFREFVMKNYKIVRSFVNPHVLFQRK